MPKWDHFLREGLSNTYIKLRSVKYNLRETGIKLALPHFDLEWLHKSFAYITSSLWNKLPVEIYADMFLR